MEKHQYSDMESHLKAYQAECEGDPFLKQFDLGLQQSTGRVIHTLKEGVNAGGDRSLPLESVKEITGCFVKTNVEVAKYILKFKEEILRDDDLYEIVKDFFDKSLQILEVCTVLKECINRARDDHLIIEVALHKIETEDRESGLNFLEKFKAAGNPFTERFSSLLKCVRENQDSMLQNLKEKKSKLDEKLKNVQTCRTVWNVLFGFTAATFLVSCCVAALPVVVVTLSAVALVGAGVWIDHLWKKHEDVLRAQGDILSSLDVDYNIGKIELGEIQSGVDDLKKEIESVLDSVDFALQLQDDQSAVRLTMDTIKKKLNGFMESIEDLSKHASKCEHEVKDGMDKILDKIIKYRN
ncbi:UPF0496 protein 1-like [Cornus florida]|uniref:UPF0496 protein 1-like n=1 Tax=Cornus florida TaxID=4283 RepID=UPI002896F010|nr:UPF0496 protein 1-like [Cornus florida]XP_059623730.1 UPF0496 protein 1-like [Cornus florida]XP_059623731.1 UPF0496 protein 1-like [Cornus florida]